MAFHSKVVKDVSDSGTELIRVDMLRRCIERILIVASVKGEDLASFSVEARPSHPDCPWVSMASTSDEFTSPADPVIRVTGGDLSSLAAGSTGAILLNSFAFDECRVVASSSSTSGSNVTLFFGGS